MKREAEELERALFYVAVTRAKLETLVSAHGKPSWQESNMGEACEEFDPVD